jgi:hypothetical protein
MKKKFEPKNSNSNNGKSAVNKKRKEKSRFKVFLSTKVSNFRTKNQIDSMASQGKIPRLIKRLL